MMYRGTQPSRSQPVIRNTEDTSIVVPGSATPGRGHVGASVLCKIRTPYSTFLTTLKQRYPEASVGVDAP